MRQTIHPVEADREDVTDTGAELTRGPGQWIRARPWLVDLAVVVAVFAYNLATITIYILDGIPLFVAVSIVSVLLCASYMFRRRHPIAVFGIIFLAACAQVLLGVDPIVADAMVVFALYNLAARFRWTLSVPAAVAVVAWLLLAVQPWMDKGWLNVGDVGVLVLVVVWAWTWGTLVRIRRNYIESLQVRTRQLEREREVQIEIAAAEERRRIAREIHDIVAHSLGVVVVMAEGAVVKVHSEPERAEQAMITVRDTGRSALAEMRRMLGVLRDDDIGSHAPQPGISHLPKLIEEWLAAGLPVELTVQGDPVEVPGSVDLAVYRVVQEALTNVHKHGGPQMTEVNVNLRYVDHDIQVQIIDDGLGFTNKDSENAGHGLVGMRERVAAHGGTLRTGMRSSGGFEVLAVLPIGDEQ